jgi:UDP-GlcNAc:undecaprenyl-phosphate GlcNAc-1-phosphate transferase
MSGGNCLYALLILAATSFAVSLTLTPMIRNVFRGVGLVDQPDSRKIHQEPIPRVGGIPILIAFLGAYILLLLLPLEANRSIRAAFPTAVRLVPACVLIFIVGLIDDLRPVKPWQKLSGQLAAGCLAVWGGIEIHSMAGHPVPNAVGGALTIVWLIVCTNAFNLIDGVDGLAAGIGLFASATTLLCALVQGRMDMALAIVPLVGALLGFLRFNFNPASIFLGDSGSLLVGFLLGCYAVVWSQKSVTILGLAAPLMALAIPLLDTTLAVVRRFLRRQPIFGADREHIHHKLLARGFAPRSVALILYALCGVAAIFSISANFLGDQFAIAMILVFCATLWFGIRHLGYAEFDLARRLLIGGSFRVLLNSHLDLDIVRDELRAAADVDDCWRVLRMSYSSFGFSDITFRVGGRTFHDRCAENQTAQRTRRTMSWSIVMSLQSGNSLELTRLASDSLKPNGAVAYADAICIILEEKLESTCDRLPLELLPVTRSR